MRRLLISDVPANFVQTFRDKMIEKLSPAKVNLHLSVLGKRKDGYHDLATLMQQISLYDELVFSPLAGGISITCPGSNLPENEENIVYRAARAYFSHVAYEGGVAVTIKKHIPIAAGLGGGSSNAATTLIALNEMTGSPCSRDELTKIGRKLGADVPFFIFGKTAWAFGIGDVLQAAENIPPLWFVLINPGFPVSTRMVYESLNLRLTKETLNYSIPRFQIGSAGNLTEGLKNDLEAVTLKLHPLLSDLKEWLSSYGALGALMSGSGPTVFGIFLKEEQATRAKEALSARGAGKWTVFQAHSI